MVWKTRNPVRCHLHVLRLLIERIGRRTRRHLCAMFHAAGIRSLVAELADQDAPALAASESLLEAAE